uniref:Uncharacterized protein n=1 Tax=Meloidogyne incognita TaxID=6306 RepID=A0A914NX00_MELIC
MRYVKNFLISPTEDFCNSLIKIYESNRFDGQTMLNKLPKDKKDKLKVNYEGKWIKYDVFEYIYGLSEDERNGAINCQLW